MPYLLNEICQMWMKYTFNNTICNLILQNHQIILKLVGSIMESCHILKLIL